MITCTTRAPRPGEVDGVDYHFLARGEFERQVAAGVFLVILRPFKVGDFVMAGGITGTVSTDILATAGSVTLSGTNTVTGTVAINAGNLSLGSAAIPAGVGPKGNHRRRRAFSATHLACPA